MKKIAYLLTLIMLLVPLAGCAGDDDDNSIEGDWYRYESLVLVIYQNGTLGMGIAGPVDDFGNWSTEGDILTIDFGDSNTPTGDPRTMIARFAVDGDWLWLLIEDGEDCIPFAPEMIDEDEWDDRVSELTPPSFCK